MTSFRSFRAVIALTLAFGSCCSVSADIRLPGIFGDHMVLQREQPIKVWGWGRPFEEVEVALGSIAEKTTTGENGRWSIELPAQEANNEPIQLVVRGDNTITLNDVLIGEVWLCSGQSNMEWSVERSANSQSEISAASYPRIRHIKIARRPSNAPLDDIEAEWQVCKPETVPSFTAVGYFMARRLHQELDVPIGLINSSWGGTRVEPWTPPVGFEEVEALEDISTSVKGRTPGTDRYRRMLTDHVSKTNQWLQDAKSALETNRVVSPSPSFPTELTPFTSHQDPTMLYNGMIHAFVGFPIRGAIWYQGESNHNEGMLYFEKKKALIQGWRKLWGQGDFPFYYVQIAPFQYGNEDATILPKFWEAQARVQTLPNTGMVVINDIATLNDIHPPNKQDVGARLALWALKENYGKADVIARSPVLDKVVANAGELIVHFKHTGGGLTTRDGASPTDFEIIGPGSRDYEAATAKIQGDTVVLTSPRVDTPTAVRFAWNKLAEPNLMGGTGLPVGAFRGGDEPDLLSRLKIESDHQLVYDLDLSKLGPQITYDIDRSSEIRDFSRVAYLLELDGKIVFASMDAFTDDARKIGIPTAATNASFRQKVTSLVVYSNDASVKSTSTPIEGSIEFWPNNYGPQNTAGIPGASNSQYDFGDTPAPPDNGYGCMQLHNYTAGQTVFAINHWNVGGTADLGIGNSTGDHRDWTFTGNASSFQHKRLRVFVAR